MDEGLGDTPEVQAELIALRKRVAELQSCESELVWVHSQLIEQITRENRQTEAALRVSEQKLSRIFAASPDAIAISSLTKGRYVEVNPAFERVFGFSRDEAVGQTVAAIGIWADPAQRDRVVGLARAQGEVINVEIRFRHKSGQLRDSLLSASLIEIDGDLCMLTVTRDISERKRIERLVQEQNGMLRALSRAQADFIADDDPQAAFTQLLAHLLEVTDSDFGFIGEVLHDKDGLPYLRMFGITDISWDEASREWYARHLKGEFEFRNPSTLFGHVTTGGQAVLSNDPAGDPRGGGLPPGHPPLSAFMGLPLKRGEQLVGVLGVANRPGGYDEILVERLQPFVNTCAVLIEAHRSSLRRRHAESLLRRLNEELEDRVSHRTAELQASLKELESFSYSVSHDLRAPLRGINGFSQLLLEEFGERLDEQGKEHLQRICAATLRMSDLIDAMINLAQLTRVPMQQKDVDLSRHVEAIARELRLREPGRRVDFLIEPGVRARGDERLLRVALENLLSNAWKFSARQEETRIEFGTRREADGTTYFVRDNGAGFDMQYADKLFRAFQRLHGTNEYSGTGIGLATVQRVIQRHGGRVWAEGAEGRGATFYFTLP